jgi:hypothetical protein
MKTLRIKIDNPGFPKLAKESPRDNFWHTLAIRAGGSEAFGEEWAGEMWAHAKQYAEYNRGIRETVDQIERRGFFDFERFDDKIKAGFPRSLRDALLERLNSVRRIDGLDVKFVCLDVSYGSLEAILAAFGVEKTAALYDMAMPTLLLIIEASVQVALREVLQLPASIDFEVSVSEEDVIAASLSAETPESKVGTPQVSKRRHIILLVHGIRDFALWQEVVRRPLEDAGFIVESTNYGRFNLLEFLLPINLFRNRAIETISRQIRIVRQNNHDSDISVIAHSFGTYVISKLMKTHFDVNFHKVIFCGSVVPYNFKYEDFQNRFSAPIVNEVGTRDIWPAIAESLTLGYGSAGTYGFHRPLVRDRWHNKATHGYFLKAVFCKKFWVPFLIDGEFVRASEVTEPPRLWLQCVSIIKIKYVLVLMVLLVAFYFATNAGSVSLTGDDEIDRTLVALNKLSGQSTSDEGELVAALRIMFYKPVFMHIYESPFDKALFVFCRSQLLLQKYVSNFSSPDVRRKVVAATQNLISLQDQLASLYGPTFSRATQCDKHSKTLNEYVSTLQLQQDRLTDPEFKQIMFKLSELRANLHDANLM